MHLNCIGDGGLVVVVGACTLLGLEPGRGLELGLGEAHQIRTL